MDALVTFTMESMSGLPEDRVVNSFAVGGLSDLSTATTTALAAAVADFYNVAPALGTVPLGSYISPTISRSAVHTVDVFDLTGNLGIDPATGKVRPHGSPVRTLTGFDLADPGNNTPLPSEVAMVITLEALGRPAAPVEAPDDDDLDNKPDRQKQRHTGRIYLGPLNDGCVVAVNGAARPSAAFRTNCVQAISDLSSDIIAIGGFGHLGIWSRKDAVIRDLDFVSVDDSFDTQRRRGEGPTLRDRIDVA